MARNFDELIAKMSPARRAEVDALVASDLAMHTLCGRLHDLVFTAMLRHASESEKTALVDLYVRNAHEVCEVCGEIWTWLCD